MTTKRAKGVKGQVWLIGTDDGWSAIYIDGKAVYQNHGISISDFMKCLKEAGLAKDLEFADGYASGEKADQICEDLGCLPDNFTDIEDCVS